MAGLEKFASRKFLAMAAGIGVGVLMLTGVLSAQDVQEATNVVLQVAEKVAGAVVTIGSIVGYQLAEAKVDAAK